MRHRGTPGWVFVVAAALATYLVALVLTLMWAASADPSYEFAELGRQVALYVGLILGLPTVVLAVLLFVRRVAGLVAALAVVWVAFNAFVWAPVQPLLSAWTAVVALVVLGATVAGWRRDQVGSTRSRPQR